MKRIQVNIYSLSFLSAALDSLGSLRYTVVGNLCGVSLFTGLFLNEFWTSPLRVHTRSHAHQPRGDRFAWRFVGRGEMCSMSPSIPLQEAAGVFFHTVSFCVMGW